MCFVACGERIDIAEYEMTGVCGHYIVFGLQYGLVSTRSVLHTTQSWWMQHMSPIA